MRARNLVATISPVQRSPDSIELVTDDGREFAMPAFALEAAGLDCADLLLAGDRLHLLARPVISYRVEQVIAILPRSAATPRGVREPRRRAATRQVLRHIERARFGLELEAAGRLTADGVLENPHQESIALQVAQEELASAVTIIERTWGPVGR